MRLDGVVVRAVYIRPFAKDVKWWIIESESSKEARWLSVLPQISALFSGTMTLTA
jgi:hypothetical protein